MRVDKVIFGLDIAVIFGIDIVVIFGLDPEI
jgi:hypothetical protein